MGWIDLVGSKKITNITLYVCEFEPQIITFYVQIESLFAK